MVMMDVSYPSMRPIGEIKNENNSWRSIVIVQNSNNDFINSYFNLSYSKRYRGEEILYGGMKKYILKITNNMAEIAINEQSDDEIYYMISNKKNKYLITCNYTRYKNSNCSGFLQLNSGLKMEFHIPYSEVPNWKKIYKNFKKICDSA